jgi:hypothetical protein
VIGCGQKVCHVHSSLFVLRVGDKEKTLYELAISRFIEEEKEMDRNRKKEKGEREIVNDWLVG